MTNVSLFDLWTLLHLASGVAMGLLGFSRPLAYALIVLVEVLELIARRSGSQFFEESRRNVVGDLISGVAAYEAARALA